MPKARVVEPVRESVLEILERNFQMAKRKTYLHRIIYIASHRMTFDEHIEEIFEEIVGKVNFDYCDEPLTGLFLFYPAAYFCHMVEGSEESINKHLTMVLNNEILMGKIENPKILMVCHHINQRFQDTWLSFSGKPPTLLENININSDVETVSRQTYNCIKKLYILANTLRANKVKKSSVAEEKASIESLLSSLDLRDMTPRRSTLSNIPSSGLNTRTLTSNLPEYQLLEFLTKSPHTKDLNKYVQLYGVIMPHDARQDEVWPVPFSFIPYNVFDTFEDPIPELPPREIAPAPVISMGGLLIKPSMPSMTSTIHAIKD